jgi:hypothetical protein
MASRAFINIRSSPLAGSDMSREAGLKIVRYLSINLLAPTGN